MSRCRPGMVGVTSLDPSTSVPHFVPQNSALIQLGANLHNTTPEMERAPAADHDRGSNDFCCLVIRRLATGALNSQERNEEDVYR